MSGVDNTLVLYKVPALSPEPNSQTEVLIMKGASVTILWMFLITVSARGLSVDDSFSNGFISLYKDSKVILYLLVVNY